MFVVLSLKENKTVILSFWCCKHNLLNSEAFNVVFKTRFSEVQFPVEPQEGALLNPSRSGAAVFANVPYKIRAL